MTRIRLNNVDLAWLRMENPTNPMMITVLIQYRGRVDQERLIITIKESLDRYRRFRQRIVRPDRIFSRPYWEDDPDYRVENHVEKEVLQLPADELSLQELVNVKINTALDFNRPLWKVTLVENYPEDDVIIVRIHHCIADGISLTRVLLGMTRPVPAVPSNQPAAEISNQAAPQSGGATGILLDPTQSVDTGTHTPSVVRAENGNTNPLPGNGLLLRKPSILEILAASARIVFRPADPPNILKAPLGTIKKAVWSEPFSVAEIKKIAKYRHATINDVVMAVATGAILRYIDLHKDDRKRNIRAFIMVNLRGRSVDEELGNNFGLVFLTMPLDRSQPVERLEAIKQGMDSLKASAEYAATYLILNILGQLPEWVEHLATRILDTKGTVVSTNVPGPRHQISLAGTPIRSMIAWVPQSGRIGVGLSFVSYNNQLVVGLNVDAGVVPDPERFLQLFSEEFNAYGLKSPHSNRRDCEMISSIEVKDYFLCRFYSTYASWLAPGLVFPRLQVRTTQDKLSIREA